MGSGGGNPVKKVTKTVKKAYKDTEKYISKDAPEWVKYNPLNPLALPLLIDDKIVDPVEQGKKDARDEINRQRDDMNRVIDDIEQDREDTETKASEKGRQARSAARKSARPRRRRTILTSAIGIPGEPETAGKTLLGR